MPESQYFFKIIFLYLERLLCICRICTKKKYMCLHIHVALFQIQLSFITSLFVYHKKLHFKFPKVLFFTFTRYFFSLQTIISICISFPYNEVCHTILPLGNVRTHDVNVLVTNLFTTLLYLFMYTGLRIISLFTKRNCIRLTFCTHFLAKYIFQKQTCTLKPWYNELPYSEFHHVVNKTQFPFWGFTKPITFDIVNYST